MGVRSIQRESSDGNNESRKSFSIVAGMDRKRMLQSARRLFSAPTIRGTDMK
ncbi:unnamed protein product [Victoria cruziana]